VPFCNRKTNIFVVILNKVLYKLEGYVVILHFISEQQHQRQEIFTLDLEYWFY